MIRYAVSIQQDLSRRNISDHSTAVKSQRVVFKWLPVLCSNDLVHGSWWFGNIYNYDFL